MADSQSLGEIVVSIIADTAKLDSGLNKANQSISKFDKTGKSAAKNSESLQKSLDKTAKNSQDATKKVDKLTDELKKEGKQAEQSSDANEENAEGIQKVGDKSDSASLKILDLKGAFKKLAGAFSAVAILSALKQIIDKLIEVQDQTIKTRNELSTLFTDQMVVGEMEGIIKSDNQRLKGNYTQEQKMEVTIAVEKNFKQLTDEQKLTLKQEILNLSSAMGMGITELADAGKKIVDKWDFEEDRTVDVLEQIKAIAVKQFGDTSTNFAANIESYAEKDNVIKAYGYNFEQWGKILLALDTSDNKNYKDVNEVVSMMESVWTRDVQQAVKEAQTAVKTLPDEIAAKQAELRSAESDTERAKLYGEIDDLNRQLRDYTEILNKTETELLQEVMSGKDYTSIGIKGLAEFSDVREIIVNADSVEIPGMTENYQPTTEDSWQVTIGKFWENLWSNVGQALSPNERLKEMREYNNDLAVKMFDKMNETFSFSEVNDYLNRLTDLSNKIAEKYPDVQSQQEATTKMLLELDLEYFGGEVSGISAELKPVDDILNELIDDVSKLDETDVSGFIREVEEAQQQLEKLGKTEGIDTQPMIDALGGIVTAMNEEGVGVIPSLDNFSIGLQNSQAMIDGTSIPANSRLTTSLDNVAEAYRRIAAAKAAAGM